MIAPLRRCASPPYRCDADQAEAEERGGGGFGNQGVFSTEGPHPAYLNAEIHVAHCQNDRAPWRGRCTSIENLDVRQVSGG